MTKIGGRSVLQVALEIAGRKIARHSVLQLALEIA
jgi:hypothetical protein